MLMKSPHEKESEMRVEQGKQLRKDVVSVRFNFSLYPKELYILNDSQSLNKNCILME